MYRLLDNGYVVIDGSSVIPNDPANAGYAQYLAWLAKGNTPDTGIPVLTPEQLEAAVVADVQKLLDSFAKTRGYDSILSACTYATSRIPKFAAEGQYAVDIRDKYWADLYNILGEVTSGVRPMPSSVEEVIALLPPLEWLTE